MVVFADPNCGYCKKLEKTFTEMNNVTIYTFLMPILSADSTTKSKQIWCAADPAKSWVDWMVNGVSPSGKQDCSNPLDKNLALGKSLNISGTPAIFFTDGSRIPGAAGKEMIEKKLASSSK
jgi:thiol:disulfide interchange protein DsbC